MLQDSMLAKRLPDRVDIGVSHGGVVIPEPAPGIEPANSWDVERPERAEI